MKALSLSQPWCWAVLHANKHIENRSWQPPIEMIGQQIVLHAAKSWDDERQYVYREHGHLGLLTPIGMLLAMGLEPPSRRDLYQVSALVGIATIDRVVTKSDTLPEDQKRWFFGEYGWVLTNVLSLPRPIACTGKQGLWTVPAPLTAEIAEMAAA
jgi:hypothetical protein